MLIVGAVLSTVNVALGPAEGARFPALSWAVPPSIEIPSVPSPLIPLIVTVGVAVVPLLTAMLPLAVPVVFNVIAAGVKLAEVAPP
jgi:hypothetical protein